MGPLPPRNRKERISESDFDVELGWNQNSTEKTPPIFLDDIVVINCEMFLDDWYTDLSEARPNIIKDNWL